MFANVDDDEEVDVDEIGDDAEEEDGNDAEKGDERGSDEVLRRNRREVCGTNYSFTRSQITEVINAHNKMRALEGAADMMRIVSGLLRPLVASINLGI